MDYSQVLLHEKSSYSCSTVCIPRAMRSTLSLAQRKLAVSVSLAQRSHRCIPRAMRSTLSDPHCISHELDESTTTAIISRLEARGRDSVFRSLFDTYFPLAMSCGSILEIGAGTGVICRELMSRGYQGHLTGLDQSPSFIQAAQQLAEQEGVASSRLQLRVADAGALELTEAPYDCIVMHTLLSHVTSPVSVLRSARGCAKPGSTLVVVDGDYQGLSFHSSCKPLLSQRMSSALVEATFESKAVMRDLYGMLADSGWELQNVQATCVMEAGQPLVYWKSFAEAYMPRVVAGGLLEEAEVKEWWAEQLELSAQKKAFATCTYLTVTAKAV